MTRSARRSPLPPVARNEIAATVVTLIVENLCVETRLGVFFEGGDGAEEGRIFEGAVRPRAAKELNALLGQVYRIPEPSGRGAARKGALSMSESARFLSTSLGPYTPCGNRQRG